ncbi:HlyD family secretion protein [Marinilongibacter aquaticus]|uniref:HlyD family secretion protein n=1 Tax=Marinilongibacter aquaticus TaxID=2975157 RepID=UPI0021BDB6C4|nr:HlyD family secretion protein [Marinilongibacter aquaticus]UBM60596.1 HlyD family secretion protein [Marinilongibacter aquaticus]
MEQGKKKKINKGFLGVLIAILVVGIAAGAYAYIHGLSHETTDDAQLEANISAIVPKVSGYIQEIRVKDNQMVHKGDTLFVLDDSEFRLKLMQAEAAKDIANGQLQVAKTGILSANTVVPISQASAHSAEANVATANANIEAAKVELWRAQNDYERYANLYADRSITKQQFEQAQAAKESAEKRLKVLEEQRNAIEKQVSVAARQVKNSQSQVSAARSQISVAEASIEQNDVAIENAKLFLSYTVILAPADGQLSKINLQPGQLVQAGQSLCMLVDVHDQWVVANFKETQMEKMRVGQKVEMEVDAFPKEKIIGTVNSIAPATGSKFALLPPDNASGNFVKTIQRIPVKITLDEQKMLDLLRPGMNVEVDVLIQ